MNKLFTDLSKQSRSGISQYSRRYLSGVKEALAASTNPHTLKGFVRGKEYAAVDNVLKFSLVFNDLSILTLPPGNQLSLTYCLPQWFKENFGVEGCSVVISIEKAEELGIEPDKPDMLPTFLFPQGEDTDKYLASLEPLIASERLLIQPERILLVPEKELNKTGNRKWSTLDVSRHSPWDNWQILEEEKNRPLVIEYETDDTADQKTLFEVSIPYLDGVSFLDLSKILEDESDLLSSLRSSIKSTIEEAPESKDPRSIAKDLIDPKIDAINRKFRSIVNTHSFRIAGASLGSVVMAYSAVATSGLSSAIATICGGGGIGLLGKEYSMYKEKINTVKEDPYYFLWKCKKAKK